jgi:hypothetical protein
MAMLDSGDALVARRRTAAIWLGTLLCCGCVVIAGFLSLSLSLSLSLFDGSEDRPSHGLSIDPQFLDLGDVWWTDSVTAVLLIRNESDQSINVRGITTSCDCTSVEPMSFTVPAAGSIPVEVVVSLPARRAGGAKSHSFSETIQLLVAGDSRQKRPTWRIRGHAVRALTLDREQLSLGTALVYGVEHEARAVGIVAAQNVSRSIEASSPEISWALSAEEDSVGRPVHAATLESSDVSPGLAIDYRDWNESIARLRNLGKADTVHADPEKTSTLRGFACADRFDVDVIQP